MGDSGPGRHAARARALEILYESAVKERRASEVLEELASRPDPYASALVRGAEEHRARAEELITRFSIDWPLERLALVDRLIMTMAIGELLMGTEPPTAVILDEAVELAKVFSTGGSPAYVNGVLAAIAPEVRD